MKINKSKSPFVSGADAPDEKEIAKAVKGDKFSETLDALAAGNASADAETNATRATLAQIAVKSNLDNEGEAKSALRESAEILVKSRLSKKFRDSEQSEKAVSELSDFVADDPLLKSKMLSVLKKLRNGNG